MGNGDGREGDVVKEDWLDIGKTNKTNKQWEKQKWINKQGREREQPMKINNTKLAHKEKERKKETRATKMQTNCK